MIDVDYAKIPDDELDGAAQLDPSYRLLGTSGAALVTHVLGLMEKRENRQRQLRQADAERRRLTVEVLLANIVASALHSINPDRPVIVSFHKPRYTALDLSYPAMSLVRDTLLEGGLIGYREGFFQRSQGKDLRECRLAARLRALPALRDLMARFGIERRAVGIRPKRLIKLNKEEPGAGAEPAYVLASEVTLARINARIAAADLAIPDEVWGRVRVSAGGGAAEEDPTRLYQGDQTAKALRRVFTHNWYNGGRLYGVWWQGLAAHDRRLLTIDGEPTVECDFKNLHPILLYRVLGKQLDFDPYDLPPYSRDLCKETFQRLMNRSPSQGGASIKRPKVFAPPEHISYAKFLQEYKCHLDEVAAYFGGGIGLTLQCLDSEIALTILEKLDAAGITALPVHDSFIVQARHREVLASTMRAVFAGRYGAEPQLHFSTPV